MKNIFIKTVLAIVFCFAVGYTTYNVQNKTEKLSELMLANVEALAQNELPEVVITCSEGSMGTCFISYNKCWLDNIGLVLADNCKFSGYQSDSCYTPCKPD